MSYNAPKYPRVRVVMVSLKRHALLAKEALKLKLSIAALVEKKLNVK
jgi:hypothetical protein